MQYGWYFKKRARIATTGAAVFCAAVIIGGPAAVGLAATGYSYIGHPAKVARTLDRRLDRRYGAASTYTACVTNSRRSDTCQSSVYVGNGVTYFVQEYVTIAKNGDTFTYSLDKSAKAGQAALAAFTASGHGPGRCKWRAVGSKNQGTVKLRLRVDHCKRNQMRLRAAGQGVLPDRFYAGNWIFRVPQLTSIDISPNVYSNYGYDLQYCWRGCKHKGRVRFISTDNGAAPHAAVLTAVIMRPHRTHPACPYGIDVSKRDLSRKVIVTLSYSQCNPKKTEFRASGACITLSGNNPVNGRIIRKQGARSKIYCDGVAGIGIWANFGYKVRWRKRVSDPWTKWYYHKTS